MQFLNVDLEVGSRFAIGPLRAALATRRDVFELFHGRLGGLARTHVQVHTRTHSPDAVARALTRLVASLPRPARRCWDRARLRDFNIGIRGGSSPRLLELPLSHTTIAAIAALGGRVVVTVYASEGSKRARRP